MPSDQERLAIAEEIIKCNLVRNSFDLPDMSVTYDLAAQRYCARRLMNTEGKNTDWSDEGLIAFAKDRLTVVHLARQKLAAERESARTPEERRLRAALQDIVTNGGCVITGYDCAALARKALQGAAQ